MNVMSAILYASHLWDCECMSISRYTNGICFLFRCFVKFRFAAFRNLNIWMCVNMQKTQITLYTSPYVPEPIFWISSYSSCGLRREISELSKSELCAAAAAMPLVIVPFDNNNCVNVFRYANWMCNSLGERAAAIYCSINFTCLNNIVRVLFASVRAYIGNTQSPKNVERKKIYYTVTFASLGRWSLLLCAGAVFLLSSHNITFGGFSCWLPEARTELKLCEFFNQTCTWQLIREC